MSNDILSMVVYFQVEIKWSKYKRFWDIQSEYFRRNMKDTNSVRPGKTQ